MFEVSRLGAMQAKVLNSKFSGEDSDSDDCEVDDNGLAEQQMKDLGVNIIMHPSMLEDLAMSAGRDGAGPSCSGASGGRSGSGLAASSAPGLQAPASSAPWPNTPIVSSVPGLQALTRIASDPSLLAATTVGTSASAGNQAAPASGSPTPSPWAQTALAALQTLGSGAPGADILSLLAKIPQSSLSDEGGGPASQAPDAPSAYSGSAIPVPPLHAHAAPPSPAVLWNQPVPTLPASLQAMSAGIAGIASDRQAMTALPPLFAATARGESPSGIHAGSDASLLSSTVRNASDSRSIDTAVLAHSSEAGAAARDGSGRVTTPVPNVLEPLLPGSVLWQNAEALNSQGRPSLLQALAPFAGAAPVSKEAASQQESSQRGGSLRCGPTDALQSGNVGSAFTAVLPARDTSVRSVSVSNSNASESAAQVRGQFGAQKRCRAVADCLQQEEVTSKEVLASARRLAATSLLLGGTDGGPEGCAINPALAPLLFSAEMDTLIRLLNQTAPSRAEQQQLQHMLEAVACCVHGTAPALAVHPPAIQTGRPLQAPAYASFGAASIPVPARKWPRTSGLVSSSAAGNAPVLGAAPASVQGASVPELIRLMTESSSGTRSGARSEAMFAPPLPSGSRLPQVAAPINSSAVASTCPGTKEVAQAQAFKPAAPGKPCSQATCLSSGFGTVYSTGEARQAMPPPGLPLQPSAQDLLNNLFSALPDAK